ncbi:hypothetical protein EVJ50_11760 [Synechococcus sp. RSCCF101]|uniref:hypothetical protein n=1 Tax=Synechococcus sp. RSCCF101 TaxID=2511069 RepID=UPI0012477B75|nr:hypothetical protein [Synechococcus sp. RSCCF101]QEY32806.1 hypothetical protein EVJ50_11760 [Synechococcus sp. RSCCF101]
MEARLKRARGELNRTREQTDGLRASSEGLARALVEVRSGSALLAQLTRVAPRGVQFLTVQEIDEALTFEGRANDPDAFGRINVLELALADLPDVRAEQVAIEKVERVPLPDPPEGSPIVNEVTFSLKAPLKLDYIPSIEELRELDADGMARRRAVLSEIGLLP